jgi:hypothetical protein
MDEQGQTRGEIVYESDPVQYTKLLGPDGKPYAIRRPRMKLGFDLTRSE